MAETVRRRSCGGVLPFGRHASTRGSNSAHCVSDSIAPPHPEEAKRSQHQVVQAITDRRCAAENRTRIQHARRDKAAANLVGRIEKALGPDVVFVDIREYKGTHSSI